jgi:hypothetical protein
MINNSSSTVWDRFFTRGNIRIYSLVWAIVSILFYLFFGLSPSEERPMWYRLLTSTFLLYTPTISAGVFCIANGLSRKKEYGKKVWLTMGIALLLWCIGCLLFSLWELYWGLDPLGCPGDLFFVAFYTMLVIATFSAIWSKRPKFNGFQWFAITGVATYAILFAVGITFISAPEGSTATIDLLTPPAHAAIMAESNSTPHLIAQAEEKEAPKTPAEPQSTAPEPIKSLDAVFKPWTQVFTLYYVFADAIIVTLSAALIITSWSTKNSSPWIINSFGILCFYIADMWLAYAGKYVENYQSGFFLEVFWILAVLLFGYAAVRDFEVAKSLLARQQQVDAAESANEIV